MRREPETSPLLNLPSGTSQKMGARAGGGAQESSLHRPSPTRTARESSMRPAPPPPAPPPPSAAEILGISDRGGSLAVGKDGDLALFDGDPFEYTTHCVGTIIEGRLVSEISR